MLWKHTVCSQIKAIEGPPSLLKYHFVFQINLEKKSAFSRSILLSNYINSSLRVVQVKYTQLGSAQVCFPFLFSIEAYSPINWTNLYCILLQLSFKRSPPTASLHETGQSFWEKEEGLKHVSLTSFACKLILKSIYSKVIVAILTDEVWRKRFKHSLNAHSSSNTLSIWFCPTLHVWEVEGQQICHAR